MSPVLGYEHEASTALPTLPPNSDLQSKARADELLARYHTSHSVADIEGAIGAYEETERLRPVGHENRADSLNDLGDALYHFCWHHEPDEIRGIRCIEVLREALRLRPPGHPLRDQSLHILARSLYFVLYPKVGSLDVLRESASLSREALRLRPPGHSERAASMNSLANDLERTVVEHTGDMDMLAEVTSMRREILRMHPPGDPWRQHALSNLGGTLSFTFEHLGGSDLLAEAISVAREAMQLHPAGHPRRFATLNTLGSVLTFRYTYEGNSESLLEAVDCRREALRNQPDCHPERARLMHNLAESLLASFRHSGDGKALAEAISLYRKVVTQATPEAYTHDDALYSLAEALIAKYGNDHDRKALSEATDLYREALKLRPVGHVRRFLALEGMALVLSQIEPPSWPQALSCYQEALQLCPIGYPARARLLSGMSRCFLEIKSPLFSLSEGTSCLSDAYADTYSHVSGRLKLAIPDLQQLEIAYGVSTEIHRPGTHQENAERVLNIYTQVIGLLPLAANFGLNHSARLRALTGYDVIARDAAARAVIHGVPSQAVEILEQGRGVFWTQTLHLRTTAFDGVPEADREELQRMLRLLEHGARRAELQDQSIVQNERELEERRQLNKAVQTLITQIRGHPGLDRFLLPPAFDALLGSLPDGYVVIVNASKLGHHALLLYRPTGLATSLALTRFAAGCDYAKLRTQLPRDLMSGCGEEGGFEIRAMRIDNGRVADLEDALALLWVSIGLPVVETLGLPKAQGLARPRLWWAVTGEFSFLPIHAAGQYRVANPVCTTDYVVSSYIPTLASLTKARKLWTPIPCSDLKGLLICEAATTEGSVGYLSDVVDEVGAVLECFTSAGAQVLNKPSAHTTMSELRSLLAGTPAHVLHMACHGIQHSEPLRSSFLLQDGRLSIEDIIELNLPDAFLAFLSACQTAKGDLNAPDQAVHLAASMLFCGFRSVVGTMWSMCDEDGPKVARHFYSSLFNGEQVSLDVIAYALDDAVQALRNSNVPASRWACFMHIGG